MTTTPEHGSGDTHPQAQPTQPIPPIGATQPLPTQPAHPTNPFTAPHPAAPGEVHAQEQARRQAAHEEAVRARAERDAAYHAQWTAAQQAAAQHAAAQSFGQHPTQQHPTQQHPAQQQPVPPNAPQAAAHQPQAVHPAPYGPIRTAPAGAGVPPYGPTATHPGGTGPRKRRTWVPVVSAAAVAAVLGVAATGAAFTLGDERADGTRPASLAEIGRDSTDTVPVAGSTNDAPDWQAVAQAVAPSVVAIEVSTGQGGAQGSGVIVDDQGHIVTNNHVVAGAAGKVQVTLTDGRLFEATVVGTDPTTDLAVIKLDDAPDDLVAAALGDSSKVEVGQSVMAVGNPLGLANTVTTGIVSAVDRPVSTSAEDGSQATVTNAIQIDAAVNPGNSGGPLFDAQGRVIGINSSIATMSQQSGSIGLGFAIPVDLVKNIATQLIDDGTAEHAFLGVSLSDGTATADGVTRRGAVVEEVSPDSPASKAGLEVQDVVVAIDGKAVGGAESLTAYVRALASGDEATLTVVRDGRTSEVDVTLAARQETAPSPQDQQGGQGQGGGEGQGQDPQGPGGLPGGMTPEDLWKWFQGQDQG